jgi:hypothetical protein
MGGDGRGLLDITRYEYTTGLRSALLGHRRQVADVAVHHPKQSGDRRLIRGDARWEAAISERIDRPSTLRRLLLYLFKVGGAAAPIGPLVVVNYP